MSEEIDFERATEMIRNWDSYHQDRFYEKFPEKLDTTPSILISSSLA